MANSQTTYPIMEHFPTIQGEGFHSGKAAYFIRTGGCDVGCHWCDVKESWPNDGHMTMDALEIAEQVKSSELKLAVVTGGEPTLHNLDALCSALAPLGVSRHIETAGTNPITGTWEWITFSPKKFKAPHPGIYKLANELKVVVFNKSDLIFAEEHAQKVHDDCMLYLQPEWSKRDRSMQLIVDYVKEHPQWRVSIQTHKYLDIP